MAGDKPVLKMVKVCWRLVGCKGKISHNLTRSAYRQVACPAPNYTNSYLDIEPRSI